jgi:hypothetical protein
MDVVGAFEIGPATASPQLTPAKPSRGSPAFVREATSDSEEDEEEEDDGGDGDRFETPGPLGPGGGVRFILPGAQLAAATADKKPAAAAKGVRFAAVDDDSSSDEEGVQAIPINPQVIPGLSIGGAGAADDGGGGLGPAAGARRRMESRESSFSALSTATTAATAAVSTGSMATPNLTHEQLKFKRLADRRAHPSSVMASDSRPDAPDVDDMLRRISVVVLQHIQRGEKAAQDLAAAAAAGGGGGGGAGLYAGAGGNHGYGLSVQHAGLTGGCSGNAALRERSAQLCAGSVSADNVVTDWVGLLRGVLVSLCLLPGCASSRAAGPHAAASTSLNGGGGASGRRPRALSDSSDDEAGSQATAQLGGGSSGAAGGDRVAEVQAAAERCWRGRACAPCRWLEGAGTAGTADSDYDDDGGDSDSETDSDDGRGADAHNSAGTGARSARSSLRSGYAPPAGPGSHGGHSRAASETALQYSGGGGAGAAAVASASPRSAFFGAPAPPESPSSRFRVAGVGADAFALGGASAAAAAAIAGAGASAPPRGRFAGDGAAHLHAQGHAEGPVPGQQPRPEAVYDAEVDEDVFHETRFLRPQFLVGHVRAASTLAPLSADCGAVVARMRYVFSMPSSQAIYEYMRRLFTAAKLTAESSIIGLVYIERLLEGGRVLLRCHNW